MSRRLINVLVVAILLLGIAGCSQVKNPQNNSNTQNTLQSSTAPDTAQNAAQNPAPNTTQNAAPGTTQNAAPTTSQGPTTLRFVILADSRGSDKGINSAVVKKVLQQVKQLSPQPVFAIMPGDLIDGGKDYETTKAQLDYFKKTVTQYYPVKFFYPGFGNHEMTAGESGEKAFAETFGEFEANFLDGYNRTAYYFDAGNTRLFMLNSDHPGEMHKITGKQLDWLKAGIDASKKRNIFLMHEPPYPTGAETGYSIDKFPSSRGAFLKVVDSSNSPILFCGHEHNYSRRLIDKSFNEKIEGVSYEFSKQIFQVITGGFGAPLYTQYTNKKNIIVPPTPQYHFIVVDIAADGMKVQAIGTDGKVIDSF